MFETRLLAVIAASVVSLSCTKPKKQSGVSSRVLSSSLYRDDPVFDAAHPQTASKLKSLWANFEKAQKIVVGANTAEGSKSLSEDDLEAILDYSVEGSSPNTSTAKGSRSLTFTAEDVKAIEAYHASLAQQNLQKSLESSPLDLSRIRSARKGEANAPEQNRLAQEFCAQMPKGGMLHVHPGGVLGEETIADILTSKPQLILDGKALLQSMNSRGGMELHPNESAFLDALPKKAFREFTPEQKTKFVSLFLMPRDVSASLRAQEPLGVVLSDFLDIANDRGKAFRRFQASFFFLDLLAEPGTLFGPADEHFVTYLESLVKNNVQYIEFSKSFREPIEESLKSAEEVIKKLEASVATKVGRPEARPLSIRLNAGFPRTRDAMKNKSVASQLAKLLYAHSDSGATPWNHIVGVDLFADETHTPALATGQGIYSQFVSQSMLHEGSRVRATMHAGELGSLSNVRDAIILGAERIGHGVLLEKDRVTMEIARRISLPVEINLVSNASLAAFDVSTFDPKDTSTFHPFVRYLRIGLPVSLSTDNDGILRTNISKECSVAITTSDITYPELKAMAFNSIATSFARKEERTAMTQELSTQFERFEAAWSKDARLAR